MPFVPVILCGGAGTRLWPLSRSHLPKQFLPLVSERTMLQETVARLQGLEGALSPIAIANDEHRFLAAEQLREVSCAPQALILEPAGRGTAAAAAAAALLLPDRESVLLVLAADHAISNLPQFHAAIGSATRLAGEGALVVFGIAPASPHTGYGYIKQGARRADAYIVERFVEKPDVETAKGFLASGGYFWNSGMFAFRADRYLAELERYRPDIVAGVKRAMATAKRDMDFVRPDPPAFLAVPDDSIDRAVMEKTRDAVVVPAKFDWSDVGSWSALWELGAKDALGNVSQGDVMARDSHGSYLRSEGRLVAAVGVENLVVIETSDALLVSTRERADDVKLAVEQLKRGRRTEHAIHRRVYRPWGYYESIDSGESFQVKRLMVKPGARLSLQKHKRRAEHWVVVSGEALVTRGEEELRLRANQSTYIPTGTKHRLENVGADPLFVIEVQSGDYFGEDDIERFADDYRRA
ncbi:MAG TPA: mannose-1-phosphate guanylyltransferase/mannose-6-phosphate isomerase [Burkholderiales bacterium]|nr:mannose-1-phosphate guanylyltransferase/mannose-6-phosphate isomerase [Burkholderiales bacterium]